MALKKFTAEQVGLMAVLGHDTDDTRQSCYLCYKELREKTIVDGDFKTYLKKRIQYRWGQERKDQKIYLGD
jgi:hypothetical protein